MWNQHVSTSYHVTPFVPQWTVFFWILQLKRHVEAAVIEAWKTNVHKNHIQGVVQREELQQRLKPTRQREMLQRRWRSLGFFGKSRGFFGGKKKPLVVLLKDTKSLKIPK